VTRRFDVVFAALAATVLAVALAGAAEAPATETERAVTRAEVPHAVLAAFTRRWPHATVRGYSRETENGAVFYEVESREGEVTRDVSFHPDGRVAVVEESIRPATLPSAARAALAALQPPATVRLVEKVMRGDTIEYEVHVRQSGRVKEIHFDRDGRRMD
jgi:hypothetical protein